jgi:uncharacterized damage-inducible protein DinB
VDSLWLEAVKYHKWANAYLADQCSKLTEDQLELSAPGTAGSIASTWVHLVAAQQGYVMRLGGSQRVMSSDDPFPGMEKIKEHLTRGDDELMELARKTDGDRMIQVNWEEGPAKLPARIILVQALHHGNDHRTHICTVFGVHGLSYGEMDVWSYADATGVVEFAGKA